MVSAGRDRGGREGDGCRSNACARGERLVGRVTRTRRRRSASAVTPGPFVPARNREPWHTQVWRLRNAPVMQLAQMINTLFNAEQRAGQGDVTSRAVIVPDVVSNCLVVAGPPEIFDEMRKLIDSLDRAPVMIRLEVVMGDVPTADLPAAEAGAKADRDKVRASVVGVEEARKKMEILFRAELTTLDDQPASLQAGRREPTISSVSMSLANPMMGYSGSYGGQPNSRGMSAATQTPQMQQSNAIVQQNVGTILTLTPRANADGVVAMQLEIEDSRLAPANEGVPIFIPSKGEPVRSPVVETLTVKTTIKVADGQTVLLSDMSRQAKNGKQRVILVTVHVLPVGDQAKHAKQL